jgi:arsenite-transporting ATPase
MPLPDDKVYDSVHDLFLQLDDMHATLVDPEMTTVRLVLNPERMVIKEAQRTYTYLNLFGYPTDMVVCNRVLPRSVTDAYFAEWKDAQAVYLQQVREDFAPLPIVEVPLFGKEVVGMDALAALSRAVYGDEDPTRIHYRGRTQITEQVDGEFLLKLHLPFTSKEDVHLLTSGDELVVHVGNQKRNVILPRALVGLRTRGARFDGDILTIRFEKEREASNGERTPPSRRRATTPRNRK